MRSGKAPPLPRQEHRISSNRIAELRPEPRSSGLGGGPPSKQLFLLSIYCFLSTCGFSKSGTPTWLPGSAGFGPGLQGVGLGCLQHLSLPFQGMCTHIHAELGDYSSWQVIR